MNVLITAASRRVALVRLFKEAVAPCGGKVIAVDYETHSPALFFADKWFKAPLVKDPDYLSVIKRISIDENVSLIIPTIDPELSLWAENRDLFENDGIHVSISDPKTIDVLTDKWKTYQEFIQKELPFPHSFLPDKSFLPSEFPLFIKPRRGRGSVGAFPVRNKREYLFFVDYVKEPLLQTYLEGKEFTVDALFDRRGTLVRCVPRFRMVIRSGVSDRVKTFRDQNLTNLVTKIGQTFSFQGAINIQGKIHQDSITFFEINPRFSGGIQLSAAAGTSFAQLLVLEAQGKTLQPDLLDYTPGMIMTSYEDSLFLDSTDRLINPPI